MYSGCNVTEISHSDKYCQLKTKVITSSTYGVVSPGAVPLLSDRGWDKLMPGMVATPFLSWVFQDKKQQQQAGCTDYTINQTGFYVLNNAAGKVNE